MFKIAVFCVVLVLSLYAGVVISALMPPPPKSATIKLTCDVEQNIQIEVVPAVQ
jgi:hypothetical protein